MQHNGSGYFISTGTAQRWCNQFNNGNFELNNSARSRRPVEVNLDRLKQLIEDDLRLTTRCLAEQLGCSLTTVETYLNELGKTWKYWVWIPHELSAYQPQHRLEVCMHLVTSHRNYKWLSQSQLPVMKSGVLYINHTCKCQWLSVDQTGYSNTEKRSPSEQSNVECLVKC